eukprot:2919267-Lingulodinium_polyedra.AAC.1
MPRYFNNAGNGQQGEGVGQGEQAVVVNGKCPSGAVFMAMSSRVSVGAGQNAIEYGTRFLEFCIKVGDLQIWHERPSSAQSWTRKGLQRIRRRMA